MNIIDTNVIKDPNRWIKILRAQMLQSESHLRAIREDLCAIFVNKNLPKQTRQDAADMLGLAWDGNE